MQSRCDRFIFIMLLIMGKETAYENLRRAVGRMADVEAVWVPIEMTPTEWYAHVPPVSWNHSLTYGLVARRRVLEAERTCGPFRAAFFNHILAAVFLSDFRSRVPSVDSMDVTPSTLYAQGDAYYVSRSAGGRSMMRDQKRRFAQRMYGSAAHLIPYSEFTRRSLTDDYGISRENATVLPPGIDLSFWNGNGRRNAKPAGAPFVALFVGDDFRRKGGDLLLRIARRPACSTIEFHCVTRETVHDVPSNVVMHRGVARNSEELRQLYRAADVYLMPTRADFGPTNAISEALAMGLPVITTGVGGIDETVENGVQGIIIPPDDEESLLNAIVRLRGDGALYERMSCAARARAENLLDVEKNAARIVDIMRTSTLTAGHQRIHAHV